MTLQDEILTESRAPLQRSLSNTVGRAIGVRSDMLSGHYFITDVGNGIVTALQGFTGWQETMDVVLRNMPVLTVTIGTSEPIIPGTTIPLYRVSALLDGGLTVQQAMDEFPSLTADQIMMARDYARQHPNFGKQYPKKSFKQMLRKSGFHRLKKELAEIRGTRSVPAR
jgi:uncharacterized protein (DUF433 family)